MQKRSLAKILAFFCCGLIVYDCTLSPTTISRQVSIRYPDGSCKWTPPAYVIPEDINFKTKTIIAGYPSGDKRLTFVQMEALTGWSAKDEWDFEFLGMSNHPFIKANFPHHEGIWGWDDAGDQVVLVVRNIRRSMVEYHDILWDIGYAKTYEETFGSIDNLYAERPPLSAFLIWRDERVMDEVYWYGWFLDYWMEGGLLRDIFTHNMTTPAHWQMLLQPLQNSRDDLKFENFIGNNTIAEPFYDPNCLTKVSGGCEPVSIISAEHLVEKDTGRGPLETHKIGEVLKGKPGISDFLIEEDVWDCIWEELIVNKKGVKTFLDREGVSERHYNFSPEMLELMIQELDRLIQKYGSSRWNWKTTARDLVDLLREHRLLIEKELEQIHLGEFEFTERDFLGPATRKQRLMENADDVTSEVRDLQKDADHTEFFRSLELELFKKRKSREKAEVVEADRLLRRNT